MTIWTLEQVFAAYEKWLKDAANTQEKHIRWKAKLLTKAVEGGFQVVDLQFTKQFSWYANGSLKEVTVVIPPGLHGFALQLVIEDQIRAQL